MPDSMDGRVVFATWRADLPAAQVIGWARRNATLGKMGSIRRSSAMPGVMARFDRPTVRRPRKPSWGSRSIDGQMVGLPTPNATLVDNYRTGISSIGLPQERLSSCSPYRLRLFLMRDARGLIHHPAGEVGVNRLIDRSCHHGDAVRGQRTGISLPGVFTRRYLPREDRPRIMSLARQLVQISGTGSRVKLPNCEARVEKPGVARAQHDPPKRSPACPPLTSGRVARRTPGSALADILDRSNC